MRILRVRVDHGQDYVVASVDSYCPWVENVVHGSVLSDRLDVNVQCLSLTLRLWSGLVIGVHSRHDQYEYDQPDQYSPVRFLPRRCILQLQNHLRNASVPAAIRLQSELSRCTREQA